MTLSWTTLPALEGIPPVRQVAFLVRDLEREVDAYRSLLEVGPWTAYTLGPARFTEATYRGQPATFAFRHALAPWGPLQLELLQPLSGPSIYDEHLERHGVGLHHLGIYVSDIRAAARQLEQRGFHEIQSARGFGLNGDGAFAYFESPDPLGLVLELIEAPKVRIDPDFIVGTPSSG